MATTANKMNNSKSLDAMDLFPDMLPDTSTMHKKWVWKEESNTLEQISTGLQSTTDRQMINLAKTKKTNRVTFGGGKGPYTSSTPVHMKQKKLNKAYTKTNTAVSPKQSVKIHTSEKRSVTLNDIKGVSFDLLSENGEISESFQESLSMNQFDGLLLLVLYYFEAFFEKIAFENKTMAREPSTAEKRATENVTKHLDLLRKQLAEKYCTLILGLESEKQHHMACGKHRKSSTKRDRTFYETLYSFCCFVVWICFRRNYIELIQQELGRLFRSHSFNPHGRPIDPDEFKLAADLTNAEIHDVKLASSSTKKNKRPPIKSIINQRSPVLVALLPNPKESAAWLMDRRKALTLPTQQLVENSFKEIDEENMKVGIIGEMICGFNPFTLAPFGEDNEEGEENEENADIEGSRRRSMQEADSEKEKYPKDS